MKNLSRRLPPKGLNKFAVSPVGDQKEFRFAWDAIAIEIALARDSLKYIGTDGTLHYFQKWGEPLAFCVPVSDGWKYKGDKS